MSKVDPAQVMAKMLEFVQGVAALLDAKATPEEAAGFKEWLFAVAKAVSWVWSPRGCPLRSGSGW